MTDGYRATEPLIRGEPTELSAYDKFFGELLRMLGVSIMIVSLLIQSGVVLPAEQFSWMSKGGFILAVGFPLVMAGNELHFVPDTGLGTRDLRNRRLWAMGATAVAITVLILTAFRII